MYFLCLSPYECQLIDAILNPRILLCSRIQWILNPDSDLPNKHSRFKNQIHIRSNQTGPRSHDVIVWLQQCAVTFAPELVWIRVWLSLAWICRSSVQSRWKYTGHRAHIEKALTVVGKQSLVHLWAKGANDLIAKTLQTKSNKIFKYVRNLSKSLT